MTNREFYNAIANLENAPVELVDFAMEAIAKLDKSNAAKAEKAAKARSEKAIADAPLYVEVETMLEKSSKDTPIIAAEVASKLGISSSKATVLLKAFLNSEGYEVADFKLKVQGKGSRVVKGYFKV